jgi:Flp pilus assembly protein TadB
VLTVCAACVFAAVCCGFSGRERSLGRLRSAQRAERRPSRGLALVDDPLRRLVVCVSACTALGWLLGGLVLAAVGVVAGAGLSRWLDGLESAAQARARTEIARDLPLAVDLLAACAAAGRPVEDALRVVSAAVGGALCDRLDAICARLVLGADPLTEWRNAATDPQLGTLGRTMVRALESGAPLVDGLTRLAEDKRRERRTQAQLRARKVGVKAAGPLAACFLPAFMLIGVVPTIAGAFSHLVF